ncbi:hypothetical protein FCM35_KLT07766 [Carex littledalei]|uniref:Uncharacterized protein n=1 Tax=Carex littledalei TaxID=544730 RepID=A0A833QRW9_9POAL|nr:hypothetical protein FCM35_KLT07766 [Carex littledalei]
MEESSTRHVRRPYEFFCAVLYWNEYLGIRSATLNTLVLDVKALVLSWKPHALYFPNFASSEKCEAIVRLAKTKLRPSTLALRKGETEVTTMGIRTSILSMIRTKREEEKRIREKQLKDCLSLFAIAKPCTNGDALSPLLPVEAAPLKILKEKLK